ncbi:MAG: aspartate kinase [Crocinitomicaceae bacterium]|nr:aspartate kinase [Crocinitomicaceae bacterium]
MKVLKFGGTSIGSPERLKKLIKLIGRNETKLVVLSAMAGTTNALIEINSNLAINKRVEAHQQIADLKSNYYRWIDELFDAVTIGKCRALIDYHFDVIYTLSNDLFTPIEEKIIVAQGELISTTLFHYYLEEINVKSVLLPALDFIKTDENNEPIIESIKQNLSPLLQTNTNEPVIYITQGFICRNAFGEVDNLQRGGSDYTASLIGAAIQAEEIQIWTDIDGMHNNDPRIIDNTQPIARLSFEEAAELAYFGAKILHPQSIFPAQKYNIPVRILNTLAPQLSGTLISKIGDTSVFGVKAIAAKDNITAIRIQSSRMLLAYGFLRRVFEVFERYKTPIDMITTSEVAISLTIDNTHYLNEILEDLGDFGTVHVDTNQSIICVVGTFELDSVGYAAKILDGINHLPIRMISYGGSNHNISLLVDSKDKKEALQSLHNHLF